MNSKKIQLLLTGLAAWISLLLMITTTYGASIVIGGDYTDMGTIIIISPKPGDTPQTNGTALLNNLGGISADANNPYVIKLGPGVYDIGTGNVRMKQYVDIEGSGENTTIITGNIDSDTSGVVRGANHAEIRFLTVQNSGGGLYAIAVAIYNSSASPKMTNVTASASGTGDICIGVYNNSSSSPTMTNVKASGSGGTYNYGVLNFNSSPTMTNVTASGSGGTNNRGVYSFSGTVMIHNSVIIGSTNTIYNGTNTTTRVGNTKLDGGPVDNSGTLTCVGAYNGNYVALGTDCQ
jgi:hypothetical protein